MKAIADVTIDRYDAIGFARHNLVHSATGCPLGRPSNRRKDHAMRRFIVLILVVLLGLVVPVIGGWSSSAQGAQEIGDCDPGIVPEELGLGVEDSYQWEGVCRPIPPDDPVPVPIGVDLIMQPYAVYFAEDFAAVPDASSGEFEPEFMVVVVREGTFALDVKEGPGRVVVYGAGTEIPIRSEFEGGEPYYFETEDVLMEGETPCVQACEVPAGQVVQLGPGDRIVAEQGAICVYCLLDTNNTRGDETGILEVFVLRNVGDDPLTFSWIVSWDLAQEGDLPALRSETNSAIRGWAFFDPKTGCKDG